MAAGTAAVTIVVIVVGLGAYAFLDLDMEGGAPDAPMRPAVDRRARAEAIAERGEGVNRLRVGARADATAAQIEIAVYQPAEFDFLRRDEILAMRTARAREHVELIEGDYRPSPAVFDLRDGLPWWGLEGQFCRGAGERSIDGLSEESVLVLNPFLLLGPTEAVAYIDREPCGAPWLRPERVVWWPGPARGSVDYDITTYARTFLVEAPPPAPGWPRKGEFWHFYLESYNARDFGLNWLAIDPELSSQVWPRYPDQPFGRIEPIASRIHPGRSCRYPGGCNNASPGWAPDIVVTQGSRVHCKLWRQHPADAREEPDFTYIISFQ